MKANEDKYDYNNYFKDQSINKSQKKLGCIWRPPS